MPSSFLTADINFPDVSGYSSTDEKLNSITNYLYLLLEQLRYTLGNLGEENFNDTELDSIGSSITMPVYQAIDWTNQSLNSLGNGVNGLSVQVDDLSGAVSGLSSQVSSYEETVNGYKQQVSSFQQTVDGFQTTVASYEASVEGYKTQVSQYTQTVEGFQTTVASYEASVEGYSSQVSQYSQQVSGFQSTVASYKTSVDSYSSQVSSYSQTVEGFQSTVESYEASVDGYSSQVSTLQQTVDGFKLSVSNGEQSSTLTLKSGSTTLSSATIKFTGLVNFLTADDLGSGGSTSIYGGRIATGTLSADTLNAGTITSSSGTIGLDGYLVVKDSGSSYGRLGYVQSYSDTGSTFGVGLSTLDYSEGSVAVTTGGAKIRFGSLYNAKVVYVSGNGPTLQHQVESSSESSGYLNYQVRLYAGTLGSVTTDQIYCGDSSHRWKGVYAASGTVSTSDRNRKNSITYEVAEKYAVFFGLLKPCYYKFNNGDSGRFHVGFISQDVEEALEAAGLTSLDFAGFVKDVDENGEEIYFLRYEEFIALNTMMIQRLLQRVTALEGKE